MKLKELNKASKSGISVMFNRVVEEAFRVKDEFIYETLFDEIDHSFDEEEKGGVIVFPTDVNAVELYPHKFINAITQFKTTWKNRLSSSKAIEKHPVNNWAIGSFFKGKLSERAGSVFTAKSPSVEITGVTYEQLIAIAEDLCREFQQESVLVKSYSENKVLLVAPD